MNKLLLLLILSFSAFSKEVEKDGSIAMLSEYNNNALSYQMICLATKSFLDNTYVKKDLAKDEEAFNNFLYNLDYNKELLTKDQLKSVTSLKETFYQNLSSSGVFLSVLMKKLINQNIDVIRELIPTFLKNKDNILINISVETDPKKKDYPKDEKELLNKWKEKISLNIIYHAHQLQKADSNLKTEEAINKSLAIVQKKLLTKLDKLYNENFDFFFQNFMDGVLGAQDPHSLLMIGQNKVNFFKSFKSEYESFGFSYIENDLDEIEITEVVPESPADKTNKIHEGDIFIGIEIKKKIHYVVNFNSSQEFDKLLGELTSDDQVFFHLIKKNKEKIRVPIKKQKTINAMANYTAGILSDQNIGYLKLQSFYNDFNDQNGASSYEDVKKAIKSFNEKNVKHLIFDLRGNGGGLLVDGIKIAGLFIKHGPVVQIKAERDLLAKVDYDPDPTILWDKPLTVLIDHRTASAAEIVAAALQDYNRALILGGNSFGKGSVQQVIDLNKLNSRVNKTNTLDATLKLTTQRFYRISGKSIQWTGVIPDISVFGSNYLVGYEKDLTNSLNSDTIPTSIYEKWEQQLPINSLKEKSMKRFNNDKQLTNLKKNIDDYTAFIKSTKFDLNFDFLKKREERSKEIDDLITSLPKKEIKMNFIKHEYGDKYNTFFSKIDERFKKELEKDVQFQEALNIVIDWSH